MFRAVCTAYVAVGSLGAVYLLLLVAGVMKVSLENPLQHEEGRSVSCGVGSIVLLHTVVARYTQYFAQAS